MSTGHYHRRWSANTAGRTTPTSQALASSVEPSTYGTSWNSVRWNKPSKAGYRSQSSAIAAQFEAKPYHSASQATTSRYKNTTSDAARTATQPASLRPLASARSSYLDTSVHDSTSKYRSEARELLNKWTSRERNGAEHSYLGKPMESLTTSGYLNAGNEYPYRTTTSLTSGRSTVPTSSRFSSNSRSLLSPSPVPPPHTPRAGRPWRQRLAESSRIRASLGDDVSASYSAVRNLYARSRRNSLSQASGDELSENVNRLRSYVSTTGHRSRHASTESSTYGSRPASSTLYTLNTPSCTNSYGKTNAVDTTPTPELMSRSYSPIRPRSEVVKSLTSTEIPSALKSKQPDDLSDSLGSLRVEKSLAPQMSVSSVPLNPSIRENNLKRDGDRPRKKTSHERTARRNSRQRCRTLSSTSDEEFDPSLSRADAKRRRRRLKDSTKPALPLTGGSTIEMLNSSHAPLYQAENEADTKYNHGSIHHASSTDVSSTASPSLADVEENKNSTLQSKTDATKSESSQKRSQISDRQDADVSSLAEDISQAGSDKMNESGKLMVCSATKIGQTVVTLAKATDASSIIDDESQYSAVVHFKPNKGNTKRIAPVPGVWKVTSADEFISKNKHLVRSSSEETVTDVWSVQPHETVNIKLAAPEKSAVMNDTKKTDIANNAVSEKNEDKKDGENEISDTTEDQESNKKLSVIRRLLSVKSKPAEQKAAEKPVKVVEEKKKDTRKAELLASKTEEKAEPVNKPQSKEIKKVGKAETKVTQSKAFLEEKNKESEKARLVAAKNEGEVESVNRSQSRQVKKVEKAEPKPQDAVLEEKIKESGKSKLAASKSKDKVEPVNKSQSKEMNKVEKVEPKTLQSKAAVGEKNKESDKAKLLSPKMEHKVKPVNRSQSKDMNNVAKAGQKTPHVKAVNSKSKPAVTKEETIQTSAVPKSKVEHSQEVIGVRPQPVRSLFNHPQRIREKKPLVTQSINQTFSRKPAKLCQSKTLVQKRKSSTSTSYLCQEYSNKRITCNSELVRRPEQRKAQVTVDKPIPGVNTCRVRLRVRRSKKILPILDEGATRTVAASKQNVINDSDQNHFQPTVAPSSIQSRIVDVQDSDMRNVQSSHISEHADKEEEYTSVSCVVLPDKSLLEEYVKRKRGRLGESDSVSLRNEPRCDSPANSSTSEFLPACAVRVFERSPYGVPVITTPSRSVSRLSSVCSVEPTTPTNIMLDTLTSYNNYNSTPQGFLRDTSTRIQIAKPIPFETPKTPFEERVQQQANAIRKASAGATSDGLDRHHSPRRPSASSDGMTALSTSFTAAIAANANHGRHERYAAHIPVNRGETSGQQSTINQDSQKSGALDNATKKLDHVIDQARHKHSQHRNKFKEAIDYLDQIFEDLKKECDSGDDKASGKERNHVLTQPSTISHADAIRRPSALHLNNTKTTVSASNRITRQPKKDKLSSPVNIIVQSPTVVESEASDFDVAETIVLPKKTDKLDFTRRWLKDDLSSLAHQPPTPIMILPEPCSYYNDVDEHSLGSCSAEVAAINSNGRREKSKKNNGVAKNNPPEKPALIRPQPCRPQPVYSTPERSTGPRNTHNELEVPSIPRVASFDHVPDRRDNSHGAWRSGSQEPHQGSVASEDALRPSPSAFQSVSNFVSRGGNMRGSLRSLPDTGLIIRGKYQQQPETVKDPTLAIDQLCAELELNTEQPLTTNDKRRSFPTSYGHENLYVTGNSFYEQPRRVNDKKVQPNQCQQQVGDQYHAAVSTHQSHSTPMNNSNRVPRPAAQVQQPVQHSFPPVQQRSMQVLQNTTYPMVRKMPQRQQKSLDEVTNMLNNVVNDFHSAQPHRKRSQQSHVLYATPHSTHQSNPFETINQEKINPSRVEAMHNMFERNTAPVHIKWNSQPYPVRPREDDAYHEINEFSNRHSKRASPPRQNIRVRHSPQNYTMTEFIPAYPTTQPPSHPPGRNGSATSSQNGGYYSSNSSGISAPAYQNNQMTTRRGSIVGHQSVSSRAASIADDEDDGFYDNIGTFDDRRFSRSSEMDVASLSSHQLPPSGWKPTKIGSFLRKFGGGSRPPGSAASLVSLNKVANEAPIKSGNLMKSNSLSNEPWKKMVIEGPSIPNRGSTPSKGGFGTRIKNSIFGSKRRLNG